MEHGMSLKDASAFNIQFDGGKPVLIDTLSFEKYEEGQPWVAYYTGTNYSDDQMAQKRKLVAEFIEKVAPPAVWDFRANTGEFSRLASDRGIDTVAFDIDPAAVEKNYLQTRQRGEKHLLPL